MQETILLVKGMMCQNCERHVREALEKVSGVVEAVSDHTAGKVVVKHNAPLDEEVMKAAVTDAGYEYMGLGTP